MAQQPKRSGRLRGLWDRILSGPAPTDPLYLSNRTWKQKARLAAYFGVPLAVVVGVVLYSLLSPPPAVEKPYSEPSAAEVAARTAIIPKDFKLEQSTDLQVVEVGVDRSSLPHHVTGILRNNTSMRFGGAELTFDLTDDKGSRVGSTVALVDDIQPLTTMRFATTIPQRNVTYVLVREVKSSLRRRP